jgi:methylmalonyl-CoA mutase
MIKNQIFAEFNQQSKDDWLAKAQADLKGKPVESLSSNWYGLNIEPYYTREDFTPIDSAVPLTTKNEGWINYVTITVESDKQANNLAKEALMLGATGVVFNIINSTNYSELLAGIELEHCAIAFAGDTDTEKLYDFIDSLPGKHNLSGFIDNQIATDKMISANFFPTIIGSENQDEIQELQGILKNMYHLLHNVDDTKAEITISNIAYRVQMSTNYFFSIAKIRALRLLLNKFYRAYKIELAPGYFHILACSHAWHNKDFEPHENMLKATSSAMAAIIGGCNALNITPGDDDEQEIMVARNISSLLEFEAYLSKVADPAAGSYFLEQLTNDIVNTVWKDVKASLV